MSGVRRTTRLRGGLHPPYTSYKNIRDIENQKPLGTRMDAGFQKSRGAYQTGVRGLSDGKAGPKRRESGAYQTVVGFTLYLDVDTLKRPRRL